MTKTPPVDAFAQARPIDLPFLLLNGAFLAPLLVNELTAPRSAAFGVLPYAVTFLVSNVVVEVYARRRANRVVLAGLFASVCARGAIWLGDQIRAAAGIPLADDAHGSVFATDSWRAVLGSFAAYLAVQYVNIVAFHLLRRATGGRHLWLRNGVAMIAAQFVGALFWVAMWHQRFPDVPAKELVEDATELWYLNALLALASMPLCYAAVLLLQRWRARPL